MMENVRSVPGSASWLVVLRSLFASSAPVQSSWFMDHGLTAAAPSSKRI